MQYNDEQLLNINDYENMAKAYAAALKQRGFMIVQMEDSYVDGLSREVMENLYKIKSCLFSLGGFLNTSAFYSLNERQIKKLSLLFEQNVEPTGYRPPRDKTKCLLCFLSEECLLIKNLIKLAENSNYETQIKDIINSRLSKLNEILTIEI